MAIPVGRSRSAPVVYFGGSAPSAGRSAVSSGMQVPVREARLARDELLIHRHQVVVQCVAAAARPGLAEPLVSAATGRVNVATEDIRAPGSPRSTMPWTTALPRVRRTRRRRHLQPFAPSVKELRS